MTGRMCSRWRRRCEGSSNGREIPIKMCWKGTGKNQAKKKGKKYIFRLKTGEVGYS